MRKNCDGDTVTVYIEQIEAGEKSVSEAAKELGATEDMLYKWRKQLANDTEQRACPLEKCRYAKSLKLYLRKTNYKQSTPLA